MTAHKHVLNMEKTALVLVDLQKGIVGMTNGQEVLNHAVELVKAFRDHKGFIAFVNVDMHDGEDMLKPLTDTPAQTRALPEGWAEFMPELEVTASDYKVTKRQWGAFHGTDLDLQLRRRGIDTIVLCGISTNIGVEMTAREAFQLGYHQVFAVDAMKAVLPEEHDATVKYIFPRIGKNRSTQQIVKAIRKSENLNA